MTTAIAPVPARLRKRNRRLLTVFLFLVVALGLATPYAVRRGWIYPEEATFSWPRFMSSK